MISNEVKQNLAEFMEIKGYAKRTIDTYLLSLKSYFAFLQINHLNAAEIRVKHAQEYQKYLLEITADNGRHLCKGTIQNRIKSCICFYKYLEYKGLVMDNPFQMIRQVKVSKPIPKNLPSEKEMNELLQSTTDFHNLANIKTARHYYRLHVICELMYSTGLRIDEVSKLKEQDIDLSKSLVYFDQQKGGHRKEAFLSEYAKHILALYLEMRPLVLDKTNDQSLLFGVCGGRLIHSLNDYLGMKTKGLGIPKITSHGFRHCFGYHLLRAGCDVRLIQELMGHRRIRSTEVYTKVDKQDLRQVLDKYHPRKLRRQKSKDE